MRSPMYRWNWSMTKIASQINEQRWEKNELCEYLGKNSLVNKKQIIKNVESIPQGVYKGGIQITKPWIWKVI